MDDSKVNILNKLKDKECTKIFKDAKIATVILFGSILTEDFEEYSDIDIAVLSKKDITFNTIIFIEESLQKVLGRDIDVVNLKSENIELNMKVSIYDNGQIIYDDDNLELYSKGYAEVEQLYKDNETFRFFRERDVIFNE
ncbi:type VII toxin-antitoxin system MntA family adenylyltransferase antitoxin [uncultured Clostridium sp.]|uniref:type VII toxin-antitoxin system MntA family adenylyltransferase antitoxin n=1 Tax=uncultured Clostridium sp. TaxID=59620 RepID=UPI0028E90976|nr:nucleotidyltransferase domain-containing protein [uncultured Clostridium sp.]